MNWRNVASLLWLTLGAGCGTDLTAPLDLPLPNVVKATRYELENDEVVPASYIVAFKGRQIRHMQLTMLSYQQEFGFHYSYLMETYGTDSRVKDVRYIHALDMARQGLEESPDQFMLTPGLRRSLVGQDDPAVPVVLTEVNFASAEEATEVLAEWEKAGKLWFAEPNYKTKLTQDNIFATYKTNYENGAPWWHGSIKLLEAFDLIAGSESKPSDDDILANPPVIAVLDSGLDTEHPSFEGRIFTNSSPGIAGCVGDVNGCDTTSPAKGELGTGNVMPFGWNGRGCNKEDNANCQHGTHVAGIIAANFNGSQSVGGVCPVCKVMPIKIISGPKGKGAATDAAIINGLVYLTRFQKKSDQSTLVRIANSSFGKYSRSRSVSLMVSILSKKHQLLVVGAASNEDSMLRAYPAAFNDALAVAAVDNKDRKASYSNFGAWVDVAAPGGDSRNADGSGGFPDAQLIVSTVPRGSSQTGGDFDGKKGTSMAAPVVSGVAGLILAADPGRGYRALRSSLINSADPRLYKREGDTAFNQSYYVNIGLEVKRPLLGSGIVDAPAAIRNDKRTGVLVAGIDRVHTGCSTIGSAVASSLPSWLLLLLPGVLAAYRLLRRGFL